MYLSLFLLVTEGRGLKVIPREPPPLVCDLTLALGDIRAISPLGRAGAALWAAGSGAASQGHLLNSEVGSVLWGLFSPVEQSPALLSSLFCEVFK